LNLVEDIHRTVLCSFLDLRFWAGLVVELVD